MAGMVESLDTGCRAGVVLLVVVMVLGGAANLDCCVSLKALLSLSVASSTKLLFSLFSQGFVNVLDNGESTLLSGLFSLSTVVFGLVVDDGSSGLMLLLVGSAKSFVFVLNLTSVSLETISELFDGLGVQTVSLVGTVDKLVFVVELEPITDWSDLLVSSWERLVCCCCWLPLCAAPCVMVDALRREAFDVETLLP